MRVVIDAGRLEEKKESHEYLKELFGFPDYYGGNLDALYDCLSELSEVEIVVTNVSRAGSYYRWVQPVLAEVSRGKRVKLVEYPGEECQRR